MNPEAILAKVENLIANRPISGKGTWLITWKNGQLAIQPSSEKTIAEIIFIELDASDVTYGLTSKKWNRLSSRITNFLTQKGMICPKPPLSLLPSQKPSSKSSNPRGASRATRKTDTATSV